MVRVASLHVYPVKSCGGVDLARARVERRGLAHDRRFVLVDADGRFVTQRELAVLARVRAWLEGDRLELSAPGQAPLSLPAAPAAGERTKVRVWDDDVEGLLVPDAGPWFSALAGVRLSLVFMPADAERPVDARYAEPGDRVSFADGFPLLLISQASLDQLSERLGRPVEMRRFRPNLVVTGTTPHAEDAWRRFRVGALTFRAVKPCSRCVITTRDPDTGEAGKEPLAELSRYRTQGGKVMFGVNVIPDGEGEIEVGDPVEVFE